MIFYQPYGFIQGDSPLLVSMPHSGLQLTLEVANTLVPEALVLPDTDWHIPKLYDFLAAMKVSVIKANYLCFLQVPMFFASAYVFCKCLCFLQVPMLFQGTLPDFNMGTNDGASCAPKLLQAAQQSMLGSAYSHVSNGRFKGGHITRSHGQPMHQIHGFQLELSQATYMHDTDIYVLDSHKCAEVSPQLIRLIEAILACDLTPS